MLYLFLFSLSLSRVFAICRLLETWLALVCNGSPLGFVLEIVALYLSIFGMSRLLLSSFRLLDRCVACCLSFGVYTVRFVPLPC
jgi:hypothetical protein